MKKYLVFVGKVVAMIVPIFVLFIFFYRAGYHPLLTSSISFDAKLKFVKEHNVKQTDLLALGSSITLNSLSSAVIKDSLKMSYFNFASWGLQICDTKALAVNYIAVYKPKYLLVVSSIVDFDTNDELTVSINNYFNTSEYIRNHFEEYFYVGNFNSILEIVRRKKELAQYVADTLGYTSLNFDEFGGVLFKIPRENISLKRWNAHAAFPTIYTNSNYQALQSLGEISKANHVLFIFVQAPIKQLYVSDSKTQQIVSNHISKCKSIVEKSNGVYLNFYGAKEFLNDSLFVDQYHLSSKGATILTQKLAHSLKGIFFNHRP